MRPTIHGDDVQVLDGVASVIDVHRGKERQDRAQIMVFIAKDGDNWKVLLHPNEYAGFRQDKCPYVEQQAEEESGPSEFSTPQSYD